MYMTASESDHFKFQKGEIDASFTIIYKLKLFIPFYSYNVHITVGSSVGDR